MANRIFAPRETASAITQHLFVLRKQVTAIFVHFYRKHNGQNYDKSAKFKVGRKKSLRLDRVSIPYWEKLARSQDRPKKWAEARRHESSYALAFRKKK